MAKINSRSKGQRGERQLAKKFEEWWGTEFYRTPGSGGLHTMGFRFKDIEISGDITTPDVSFPFCVEGKNCEGWHLEQLLTAPKSDLYKWWAQATEQCPEHLTPLLVFKRNRHPFLFAMRKSDFLLDLPVPCVTLHLLNDDVVIGLAEHLWATNPEDWKETDVTTVQ